LRRATTDPVRRARRRRRRRPRPTHTTPSCQTTRGCKKPSRPGSNLGPNRRRVNSSQNAGMYHRPYLFCCYFARSVLLCTVLYCCGPRPTGGPWRDPNQPSRGPAHRAMLVCNVGMAVRVPGRGRRRPPHCTNSLWVPEIALKFSCVGMAPRWPLVSLERRGAGADALRAWIHSDAKKHRTRGRGVATFSILDPRSACVHTHADVHRAVHPASIHRSRQLVSCAIARLSPGLSSERAPACRGAADAPQPRKGLHAC